MKFARHLLMDEIEDEQAGAGDLEGDVFEETMDDEEPEYAKKDDSKDESAAPTGEGDASEEDEAGSEEESSEEGEEVPSEYTPNGIYTVLGEDKEFPDKIKAMIKSEEDEKLFRDLFERADAIEHFKVKTKDLHSKYSSISQEHEGLLNSVREVGDDISRNDFISAFEKIGVNPDAVLQWAVQYATIKQNPAQYQQYMAQRAQEQQYRQAQMQASRVQSEGNSRVVEMVKRDLDTTLSDPSVIAYEKEFDARVGRRGAFREELTYRGDRGTQNGIPPRVQDVVREIQALYPLLPQQKTVAAKVVPSQGKPTPKVIPSVGGSSRSPLSGKPKPNSLRDIRKLAREGKF